ncbi:hypothetical protein O9992_13320 [Vibrio lentus]|nr:hypothetical protein [Vibrio lentus]
MKGDLILVAFSTKSLEGILFDFDAMSLYSVESRLLRGGNSPIYRQINEFHKINRISGASGCIAILKFHHLDHWCDRTHHNNYSFSLKISLLFENKIAIIWHSDI